MFPEWWGIAICILVWHIGQHIVPIVAEYIEYLIDKE